MSITIKKIVVISCLFISLYCNSTLWATVQEVQETQKDRQQVGKVTQWFTTNGMKVLYQKADSLPMIDFRLIYDAGAARDSQFKTKEGLVLAGLAKLTNGLVYEGTNKLTANQIADQFTALGVQYGSGSYRDMAIINIRTLSYTEQRNKAFNLLTEILAQPIFPDEAMKREIERMIVALDYEEQTPSSKASRLFYETVYKNHPYGSPTGGSRESLRQITQNDVLAYYQKFYVAKNVVLAIVGDLSEAQARDYAEQIANVMPSGEKAPSLPTAEQSHDKINIKKDHPSTQTTVLMGQPVLQRGDKDRYALSIGNHILGGSGFSSRLMQEVRVKRGLTYSIGSHIIPMHVQGPYLFSFTTKKSSTEEAIQLVEKNLKDFIDNGPTEEEIINAKLNITGSHPLRQTSNKDIVQNLAVIGFYDLPLDFLDQYVKHIETITLEQIKDAFKRRVHPETMTTIIVGPEVETTSTGISTGSDLEKNKD